MLEKGMKPAAPDVPKTPPVSEEEIRQQEIFELESPDRTWLSGPRSRFRDAMTLFHVCRDFIRAFRTLHFAGPCVTIFGSARTRPESDDYRMAVEMGAACARLGFTTMTGGGPGIMEAANKGAFEAGGCSLGVNIELPFEQHLNPYVHRSVTMRYFFTRKTILLKYSYAFVVLPGGFGSMDEMFETLTLIQTGKLRNFPLILMGKDYWQPLVDFVSQMVDAGTISPGDQDLIFLTDDVDDAKAHLQRHAVRQFGLRRKNMPRAIKVLGEKAVQS